MGSLDYRSLSRQLGTRTCLPSAGVWSARVVFWWRCPEAATVIYDVPDTFCQL